MIKIYKKCLKISLNLWLVWMHLINQIDNFHKGLMIKDKKNNKSQEKEDLNKNKLVMIITMIMGTVIAIAIEEKVICVNIIVLIVDYYEYLLLYTFLLI